MHLAVIIPAAGSSRRYVESAAAQGVLAPRQKIDEDLGGRPLLQRTVELFNKLPDVVAIIVAGPADDEAFGAFNLRHGDKLAVMGVKVCRGGREHRYQTVAEALKLVPATATHIAVHDAARPCASPELIERVLQAARAGHGAVIPGVDVPDTLKRVSVETVAAEPDDPLAGILGVDADRRAKGRLVEQTVDRSRLVGVQTPQVFEAALLRRAYAQKDLNSTDDAQLVERLGEKVVVVAGESTNIKVTRAEDLKLARAILGLKPAEEKPAHMRF
jgi:2-C-methyl-D-erythritol 4-phosphate cytidylyltransferase